MTETKIVTRHYARHGALSERILSVLAEAGRGSDTLSVEDLSPLDQFHLRGHQATRELAEAAALQSGHTLLDIGCGIGGPARMLAQEFGPAVTGVDLTEAYCRTAAELTQLVDLAPRPRFVCADATALPFPAESFDIIWTQHAARNIPDKAALYGEALRVARRGGRFVLYDVVLGAAGAPYFPAPWAATPNGSFLVTGAEVRQLVAAAGFREIAFRDLSKEARAWNQERRARIAEAEAGGRPALGAHMIMGPEFPQMIANVGRSLEEDRVGLVSGLFEKPT